MKRIGTGLSVVIIGLGLTFLFKPDPTPTTGPTRLTAPAIGPIETPSRETNRRININAASAAELETLPGIGPTTARAIVEHRQQHGLFVRPEDLLIVDGIGEKTYQALAELISVE